MKTIKGNCKAKHGITDFYYYDNGNSRCRECAKDLRKKRYAKDSTYDLNYAKKWNDNNPDKIKAYRVESIKIRKLESEKKRNQFFSSNEALLKRICDIFEINNSHKELKNLFAYDKNYSDNEIISILVKRKRRILLQEEAWRQSALVKHEYGISNGNGSYENLSENTKLKIREEYKSRAKAIVDKKIKNTLKQL